MLIQTFNLLVGIAWLLFVAAILLYIFEYYHKRNSGVFEVWIYKFILLVISATMFFSLSGLAPEYVECGVCTTISTVSANITQNSCTVICGSETIEPDAGQVWLFGAMGVLSILLAISWGILALSQSASNMK